MEARTLDPQAVVLLEKLARAGVRPVSEQTPAAARRAGLRLMDVFDQHAGDTAIVRHLNRTGGDTVAGIAALGFDEAEVAARLESLFAAGVVLRRPDPAGGERWTVRIGGRRRARSAGGVLDRLGDSFDADERLAVDAAADEDGVVLEGGTRDVILGEGVEARIYRPEAAPGVLLPVCFFIHGGGWVIGSISTYDGFCRSMMARSGVAVVSVNYRLAPEHPFPAAVEDVERLFAWFRERGEQFGLDPSRVALMGDSVGGGLCAVLAMRARDEGWGPIALLALAYPVTDATMALPSYEQYKDAPLLSRADMAYFYRHYAPAAGDWRASPLHAPDLSGLPPALIVLAGVDPVHDDGEAFAERLEAAGGSATIARYDGMFHGFLPFAPALDAATDAQERLAAALRQHLGMEA